jgi:hypothetical protein
MDMWAAGRLVDWAVGRKGSKELRAKLDDDVRRYAADLAGSSPSPVEATLCETAAVCWLALRLLQANYAGHSAAPEGMTIKQAEFEDRRIDRAHRRLMSTLRTLAAVRRAGLPAAQITLVAQAVTQQVVPAQTPG